ncbi:diphthine synthase [Candidatus Woesearchaeota archaeon]|nr:diphthine synthase [Candidatus Woesearchaeota archaeon]
MTLYMIGIGLWDEKDISLKGLEAVKKCDKVFLESYTSKLGVPIEDLEKLYGKEIILADRDLVEKRAQEIIEPAKQGAVAFLVIGDVFGATTHTDIFLRAKEAGTKVVVINNASILNAIGIVGLELYKFGKTTSIPFHSENVETPYNVLKENQESGMHTLLLLDIHADDSKYMSIKEALEYLLKIEAKRKEGVFTKDTSCVGVARLGSLSPGIIAGKASDLLKADFGGPLHSLIVPGKLHFVEEDALKAWKA